MNEEQAICKLCGHPMPPGEEMFYYHGYSGPCPEPPIKKEETREMNDGSFQREGVVKNLPDENRPADWNGWSHEERCRAILDMINDATKPKFPYKIEEFGSFGFTEWEKLEVLLATAFYMIGEDGPSGGWFRNCMQRWFDNSDIRMQRILEKMSERSSV